MRGTLGSASPYTRSTSSEVRRQREPGCVGCHATCSRASECRWMQNKSLATEVTLGRDGRVGRGGEEKKEGRERERRGEEERGQGEREEGRTKLDKMREI